MHWLWGGVSVRAAMGFASVPGVRAVATYRVSWLRRDLVAGIVLTTLLVPQGMAYAELAGLPAITGLYTSILCLLGYALFGPVADPGAWPGLLAGPDDRRDDRSRSSDRTESPERAIALASMLALIVGAIMIAGRASRSSASSPTCCPSRRRSAT